MRSVVRYKRVLVATDLSVPGNAAIPHAFALLGAGGGTVIACHVLEAFELPNPLYAHYSPIKMPTPVERRRICKALEVKMREVVAAHTPSGRFKVACRVVESRRAIDDAILLAARSTRADALVIATHGHSLIGRILLGSTAERLIRKARMPVLIVRA